MKTEIWTVAVYNTGVMVENPEITWASANVGIATVEGGIVSGVSKGTTKITATYTLNGKEYKCSATVIVTYASVVKANAYYDIALATQSDNMPVEDLPATIDLSMITAVKVNNETVVFNVADGKLYIAKLLAGQYDLLITADEETEHTLNVKQSLQQAAFGIREQENGLVIFMLRIVLSIILLENIIQEVKKNIQRLYISKG